MPNQAKSFVKHDIESQIVERSPAQGMGSQSTHHLQSTADATPSVPPAWLCVSVASGYGGDARQRHTKHRFCPFTDLPSPWL